MIALAAAFMLAAWLWWTGIEVVQQPALAQGAFACGALLLFAGYARAGRRLGAARTIARAALWTVAIGGALYVLALAADPVVDALGPWLSFHEAPAGPLAFVAALFGVSATAGDGHVLVQDFARLPAHATHWHQLGILPALALLTILALVNAVRARAWWRSTALAAGALAVVLPLRFVLVTRVFDDLGWLGAHWHPAAVACGLFPAAWIALTLRPMRSLARLTAAVTPHSLAAGALVAVAALLFAFGSIAEPSGPPRGGRVLIDDAHCDWAWTTIPWDREHYGRQTTYSYVSWLDFLAHHFEADTNASLPLLDGLLERYDVLILKTPTAPFEEREREAIERFVRKGGGLFLIGDHTNLFGMTTYLNPIAATFGIEFQTDDTYELVTGGQTRFAPSARAAHAALAHMPPMTFETSCSLRPSPGLRTMIVGRGLGSEPVDYAHVNFFGNIEPDPDESWGVFLQAASKPYGQGRVVAFTDSTVFSNFSVFYRGVRELGLGTVAYLNRGPGGATALVCDLPRLLALALLAGPVLLLLRGRSARHAAALVPIGAAAALAAIAGSTAATRYNAAQHPLPRPRIAVTQVAFDVAHTSFRLPTLIETNVGDPQRCFDAFFVGLQRLHLFPRVSETVTRLEDDDRVYVVLNAVTAPSAAELERLYAWVKRGGTLLVMEPLAGPHAAANRFLEPGALRITAAFPGQPGPSLGGLAIYGGDPAAYDPGPAPLDPGTHQPIEAPRVSVAHVGKGTVVALLGSELMSLQTMGQVFNEPSPVQRAIYERVYALFEKVVLPGGWPETCTLARVIGEPRDKLVRHAAEPDQPAAEGVRERNEP